MFFSLYGKPRKHNDNNFPSSNHPSIQPSMTMDKKNYYGFLNYIILNNNDHDGYDQRRNNFRPMTTTNR
ncbi:hypothetical protein DERP_014328 [Dermatophagoides pteronyssinus]|uniref:Uncharacterized protein n=1 Tax=Dermatophagoides pteronyssinus TaxID=6956 RepID=A0ABQ8JWR4_DERPT|nr:hypothetical protein DERP_014328 [Dermatophagoides pteronyssinus]